MAFLKNILGLVLVWLFTGHTLFASKLSVKQWKKDETFSQYLNTQSIHPDKSLSQKKT